MLRQKAFTLIEVLIVILILGTLATIAMPMFEGMTIKARLVQSIIDVNTIEKSLDLIIAESGWDCRIPFPRSDIPQNDYFNYDVIFLAVERSPTDITTDGFNILVGRKEDDPIRNPLYCRSVNRSGERKWRIYSGHPWAKYIKGLLPDAEYN